MPTNEVALAGIKENGLRWKHRVGSITQYTEALDVAVQAGNAEAANASLRDIGKVFQRAVDLISEDELTDAIIESLDYFLTETLDYELEIDDLEDTQEGVNYYLAKLYDFADYHRILLS